MISLLEELNKELNKNQKMTFDQLEASTRIWAEDKGITGNSTVYKQHDKLHEEVCELKYSLDDFSIGTGDLHDVLSEAGDCLVVLINIINMTHPEFTLTDCLQIAYDKISKRTGKMENGFFVKDKK